MKTIIVNINVEYAFDVHTVEQAIAAGKEVKLPREFVCGSYELVNVLDGNQTVSGIVTKVNED